MDLFQIPVGVGDGNADYSHGLEHCLDDLAIPVSIVTLPVKKYKGVQAAPLPFIELSILRDGHVHGVVGRQLGKRLFISSPWFLHNLSRLPDCLDCGNIQLQDSRRTCRPGQGIKK